MQGVSERRAKCVNHKIQFQKRARSTSCEKKKQAKIPSFSVCGATSSFSQQTSSSTNAGEKRAFTASGLLVRCRAGGGSGRAESRLEQAVPACTFPPGGPQQSARLQSRSSQPAPHPASWEASGPKGRGGAERNQDGKRNQALMTKRSSFLG